MHARIVECAEFLVQWPLALALPKAFTKFSSCCNQVKRISYHYMCQVRLLHSTFIYVHAHGEINE
jgi:hypothetical protein